jgi:sugar phosphate isomerase/epimerase
MKLGVFALLFGDLPLGKALDKVRSYGLSHVEIGAGAFMGKAHCDPAALLESEAKLDEFRAAFAGRALTISTLSCYGNPLHPDSGVGATHAADLKDCVRLAAKLSIGMVNCFAGMPEGAAGDRSPNWVTCPWPPYYSEMVRWQWTDRVLPFWREMTKFSADHGVVFNFEMHPGDWVYCPDRLLQMRDALGEVVGCNFDASHLFWQGINPSDAVRRLGGLIRHMHAKDTRIYPQNCSVYGVLDTKPYSDEANRSWIFRTVGYGHDADVWKDIFSTLRMVGFDGVVSIEHEDSLLAGEEGLTKAIAFLKECLLAQLKGGMWWA